MKLAQYITSLWMAGSILATGFLAQSAQFHEWLHVGDEYCESSSSHCHETGQKDHHHEDEGAEEHPHGLLSLMAGASMDGPCALVICAEPEFSACTFQQKIDQQPVSSAFWAATQGRAPPSLS